VNPELVAEYHRLLSQAQQMLAHHREEQWVSVLQKRRDELTSGAQTSDLRQHVVQTARSLGGLDSMSLIAVLKRDDAFTQVLDALYATCREIWYASQAQGRR